MKPIKKARSLTAVPKSTPGHGYNTEKHLRKFCTVTSHELSNVLGALVGELDFALTNDSPAQRQRAMEVALHAAERAQTLAINLRYFAVHTRLDLHTVDLSQLTLDTLDLVEKELERKGVELSVLVDAGTYAMVDAGAVQQVIMNLLNNAGFAMPDGGKLELTLRQLPKTIELKISDTGVGIPSEKIDHVFEPYFFAHGGVQSESLGLGLAVSKALVEAHGGEITVESTEDVGTAFTVSLPFDSSIPRPTPFGEKRKFRRVSASLPVIVGMEGSKETFRTELITLSTGGCFVLLPDGALRMPEANANLSLQIFHYGNQVVEIPKARVANLCRVGLNSGMGVEFVEVSPKAKRVLEALVKSHAS